MTKLEEAARALAKSDGWILWDHVPSEEKNLYRHRARAVVKALKNPSDDILMVIGPPYEGQIGQEYGLLLRRDAWNNILDAILAEEQK